jgi:exonuclease SbcC
MQILSIRLKNIKSHRDTELTFSSGINVLSGPNGAGKSTVFEAIGYALFGVDARDFVSNVDRFLTIGAKRGEISVVFRTDDGDTWQVTRMVGTPSKWLLAKESEGIFEVEEHARIEETEARITELLGLSGGRPLAEQFKLVIGPFQNEFLGPFIIKQPTKRQEAFDEILGIDAWRKTYKGTTSLITAVQKKIEVLSAEVKAKNEQISVLPNKENELSTTKTTLQSKQSELENRRQELNKAVENLQKLDQQKAEIDKGRAEIQQIETNITAGKEHITNQETLVTQAEEAVKIVAEARAGKERFDKAEALLKVLRERDAKRQNLQRTISDKEKRQEGLLKGIELEKRELERLSEEIRNGEQELAVNEEALVRAIAVGKEKERKQSKGLDRIIEARSAFEELAVHKVEGALPYIKSALERLSAIDADLAVKKEQLKGADEIKKLAGQLPEFRKELLRLQDERARILGMRQSLLDGRNKLEEGVCPFFQEPCQNIAGKSPADVFTTRVEKLDEMVFGLDKTIVEMEAKVCSAEKADKETVVFQGIRKEMQRLEEERRNKDAEREKWLKSIDPHTVAKSLDEWIKHSGLTWKIEETPSILDIEVVGAPAQQLLTLETWSGDCLTFIVLSEELLDAKKKETEEPLRETQKELAGLTARQDELNKKRKEFETKGTGIAEREQRISGLENEIKVMSETLQNLQEEHKGYAGLEREIAAAEKERTACQLDRDRFVANSGIAEELPARRKRLEQFKERLAVREKEKEEKLAILEGFEKNFRIDDHLAARQEQDKLRVMVATVEQELKGLQENLKRLEGEIGQLKQMKKEIDEKLAEIKTFEDKEKLAKFLRNQVFKNVSSQLSKRFREEISLRADRIYRTIAEEDEELIWGDNYQIVLRDMADGAVRERTDDQLSGGQTMSAVVALRLALLQTIGARIAFFDEPTSNLDASRRENLAHAFRSIDIGREEVTEHWYDQLFLISHDVAFTEITDQMIQLGE